jgi:hypothetical protein
MDANQLGALSFESLTALTDEQVNVIPKNVISELDPEQAAALES